MKRPRIGRDRQGTERGSLRPARPTAALGHAHHAIHLALVRVVRALPERVVPHADAHAFRPHAHRQGFVLIEMTAREHIHALIHAHVDQMQRPTDPLGVVQMKRQVVVRVRGIDRRRNRRALRVHARRVRRPEKRSGQLRRVDRLQ